LGAHVLTFAPRAHLDVLSRLMPHVDAVTGEPERIRNPLLQQRRTPFALTA
jgi:hypothetical protein